jgi:hypothetical protein
MNEAKWLGSADPSVLTRYLAEQAASTKTRRSQRKERLFGCACVRRIWSMLTDERSRAVVEVAERYADGLVKRTELTVARRQAIKGYEAIRLAQASARQAGFTAAVAAASTVSAYLVALNASRAAGAGERPAQADLARCVFGNPFRPVCVNPAWLTPTVVSLAAACYDERQLPSGELESHRLGILADALEEQGAVDLVAHLRSPCPHVRGCWAIDLILGKQ